MVLGIDDKKFADKPFDIYKTEDLGFDSKKKMKGKGKRKMMKSDDIFAIGSKAK